MDVAELSERIEARSEAYAQTFDVARTSDWLMLKLNEEVGELTRAVLMIDGQARDHGLDADELHDLVAEEVADVFAHVLLVARHFGVEVEAAIAKKWL